MNKGASMDGLVDSEIAGALRPGTTLGRYEIRRLLGQGGMGRVYEAQHRDLKKRVAIKTLLPELASKSDARERFLREGEAASRIRHPHVVDVTDVGSEGAIFYLVMEYLEGEDLARLIARQGCLSPTQSADIMVPVAAAISTAHQQGVIHRDLKPENIFLARSGYGGVQPKVLDFGISKVLGGSRARVLTGTAATMGTMNYLPPEALQGAREADARSDQYALGTIIYECVTGQRAFEEDNFYQVLKQIAEGQFVPPSKQRPDLPPRLEKVILRAMSLDPARRFESVRELGAALLEFASESVRGFWSPSFGSVPADLLTAPPRTLPSVRDGAAWESRAGSGTGPGSGPRVATLAAPVPMSGGTLELPPPPRSASTTMRNATGERTLRSSTSSVRRSRVPLLIGGGVLVVAVASLAVLRGVDLMSSRHTDPAAVSVEPPASSSPPSSAASPAPRPVVAPERPAGAAEAQRPAISVATDPAGDTAAVKAQAGAEPLTKRAGSGGLRNGVANATNATKKAKSRRAPKAPAAPQKSDDGAVIID
jgi:serine/threonine protein kinase